MTITKDTGEFKPTRVLSLKALAESVFANDPVLIGESDLLVQDGDRLVQFSYAKPDDEKKYEIKPGSWALSSSSSGLQLSKIELRERRLLESVTNTAKIMNEANVFFDNLHIYDEEGLPKKRGVLLFSAPGLGKSSAIEKVCQDLLKTDAGTVIVNWPTSEIDADDFNAFLSHQSEYTTDCKRMVLIIEDIGGGENDEYRGRNPVSSGLLNLLDGIGVTFKLPTLIIATTNHPEQLLEALADRPGRFDLYLKFNPPSSAEKIALMEFISKRPLTKEEEKAITKKGTEKFSIAHLEEIRIRSRLHKKSYDEVVNELLSHTKMFKEEFADKSTGKVGLT